MTGQRPHGAVVGTTDVQTLTNKSIDVVGNTVANAFGAIMAAPTTATAVGTVTSGTTETRDAVLGNHVFTALAGRRYRVCMDGLNLIANTVAADQYGFTIRNGGASTPTAASTLVLAVQSPAALVNVAYPIPLAGTFVPGAGTVTLSLFCTRLAGTGTGNAWSNAAKPRSLSVIDVGTL